MTLQGDILGFDIGMSRTGVARLHTLARIAEPLDPIIMSERDLDEAIAILVEDHQAVAIVVGLPRGLQGQETAQTTWVREITDKLEDSVQVPVFFTDEAGTTKQAETIRKGDESLDSVAAGIIVEDFANQVMQGKIADVEF